MDATVPIVKYRKMIRILFPKDGPDILSPEQRVQKHIGHNDPKCWCAKRKANGVS